MALKHRQIDAFKNVMITGTTTGAGNLMGISQPAVSRLIADLEIELKFPLFKRHKGRLHPTLKAVKFYQGVQRFYMGLNDLNHVANEVRTEIPTALKICATPALSTFFFPKAIREFRKHHENVELVIESCSSSEVVSRLQNFLVHLAVTISFPDMPGITQKPLITAPQLCAMHESHPLAKKDVIRANDFEGEQVLGILPSGLADWSETMGVLDDVQIRFNHNIGIQNSHTGYSLIAEGLAIGLIEPFAASTWRNNAVVTRPFEPKVNFEYVIAYPENQLEPTALAAMVDAIKEIVSQQGIIGISQHNN